MSRTIRLSTALVLTILSASSALAQTDGFLVTNAAGDTLLYAAPDGTIQLGRDARVAADGRVYGVGASLDHARGLVSLGATSGAGFFSVIDDAPGFEQAGYFGHEDTDTAAASLQTNHYGLGPALYAEQSGAGGNAGLFRIEQAANNAAVIDARTVGTGRAGTFNIDNVASGASTIDARTNGTGGAGTFIIDNPANTFSAVFGRSNGSGASIQGRSLGSGDAVFGRATGGGTAIQGLQASTSGWAGKFDITDASNGEAAVLAFTLGSGPAVSGVSSEGAGGKFSTSSASVTSTALDAITNGAGSALRAIQNSGGGSTVAEFAVADGGANYDTVMRVATDGNVYADGAFNGGGADFAERFEVVGEVESYEIGDVLSISTQLDRHLERSAEPYSTRILGVYATRPGVLLGDPSISPDETVPVGVVGVVPTKVTGEGGPIHRGDLLVTSPTAGHAMRGEPGRVGVGMVIGKALQDFDGTVGMIEVMVNVQ